MADCENGCVGREIGERRGAEAENTKAETMKVRSVARKCKYVARRER